MDPPDYEEVRRAVDPHGLVGSSDSVASGNSNYIGDIGPPDKAVKKDEEIEGAGSTVPRTRPAASVGPPVTVSVAAPPAAIATRRSQVEASNRTGAVTASASSSELVQEWANDIESSRGNYSSPRDATANSLSQSRPSWHQAVNGGSGPHPLSACLRKHWMSISACGVVMLVVIVAVAFTVSDTTAVPPSESTAESSGESGVKWPLLLNHRVHFPPFSHSSPWPTNTREAALVGWQRVAEGCIHELGEAWLYRGTRSPMHPVALYFSPEVGDSPGHLTGLEVYYYGRILEGLVGTYFAEKGPESEGEPKVYSIAVGFRDSNEFDLCDATKPLAAAETKFLVIAPKMARILVPTSESSPELGEEWYEGSCIQTMGNHYFKSTVANGAMTYKMNTVMPVAVLYHPGSGDIAGIFFWAPQRMQVWDEELCSPALKNSDVDTLFKCFSGQNFWDPGPALSQANEGQLFMCANTCDRSCYFEDSFDGTIDTMHFFFYDPSELACPPGPPGHEDKYCRNGFEFDDWLHDGVGG